MGSRTSTKIYKSMMGSMQIRRACYPTPLDEIMLFDSFIQNYICNNMFIEMIMWQIWEKNRKKRCRVHNWNSSFDNLLIFIMIALSSLANSSFDIVNVMLMCKLLFHFHSLIKLVFLLIYFYYFLGFLKLYLTNSNNFEIYYLLHT